MGKTMTDRQQCIEHTKSVLSGTWKAPVLTAGMFVELHCDCSIHAVECDAQEVQLLRPQRDGWWFVRNSYGGESLVHEQELIVPE